MKVYIIAAAVLLSSCATTKTYEKCREVFNSPSSVFLLPVAALFPEIRCRVVTEKTMYGKLVDWWNGEEDP